MVRAFRSLIGVLVHRAFTISNHKGLVSGALGLFSFQRQKTTFQYSLIIRKNVQHRYVDNQFLELRLNRNSGSRQGPDSVAAEKLVIDSITMFTLICSKASI